MHIAVVTHLLLSSFLSDLVTLSLLRFPKLSLFFSLLIFILPSIISPLLEQHHLLER
jgi:uncharacterized membrane protein